METKKIQKYFFLGLFLAVTVLTLFVFLPFLNVISISIIFAVTLYPLYRRFSTALRGYNRIAALLVILVALVVVIIPASFLSVKIFNESRSLYTDLAANRVGYLEYVTNAIETPVQKLYPSFTLDLQQYTSWVANWVGAHIGAVLSSTAKIVASLLLVIVALYFLLKDGPSFLRQLKNFSPLEDRYDEQIFAKIQATINSVVRGALLIALLQGVITGIGLAIFGVPNATLWGSVAALAALVPGLGTAIVVVPAVIYLYVTGSIGFAIGLLIWGLLLVGLIDNFLAPYFYSKGVRVHPLPVLFSVLGGLIMFGPIGFLMGPIVLTLYISLVDIYRSLILENSAPKSSTVV